MNYEFKGTLYTRNRQRNVFSFVERLEEEPAALRIYFRIAR
jgi:hypothetical protein